VEASTSRSQPLASTRAFLSQRLTSEHTLQCRAHPCELGECGAQRGVCREGSGVVLQDCSNVSGTRGSRKDEALASSNPKCLVGLLLFCSNKL